MESITKTTVDEAFDLIGGANSNVFIARAVASMAREALAKAESDLRNAERTRDHTISRAISLNAELISSTARPSADDDADKAAPQAVPPAVPELPAVELPPGEWYGEHEKDCNGIWIIKPDGAAEYLGRDGIFRGSGFLPGALRKGSRFRRLSDEEARTRYAALTELPHLRGLPPDEAIARWRGKVPAKMTPASVVGDDGRCRQCKAIQPDGAGVYGDWHHESCKEHPGNF